MSEDLSETIERFERLAAWHRINAERAGALWVWEARLRTAEDLEGQAQNPRATVRYGEGGLRAETAPGEHVDVQ